MLSPLSFPIRVSWLALKWNRVMEKIPFNYLGAAKRLKVERLLQFE